ncbi:MAG: hypothetical protein RIS47_121, partial [Bacteroidota bacterium]
MKFLHRLKISLKILAIAFTDELRTIGGDSGAMLLLVGAMIIYPIVYSVAYEKENVTQIPISVVDNDHSPESRKLIQLLGAAPALFVQQEDASFSAAKLAFRNGNVKGIVVIPSNFAKQLFQNQQTKIPVYCDASYFLLYKETLSGVLGATSFMGAQTEAQKLLLKGKSRAQAAAITEIMPLQINTLFNPASGYGTFVMPGMILIILQQTLLVGIGLVGGAGREDTNNQLIEPGMRLRDGIFSLVLGKSFAYVAIYTFNYIL